MENFYSMDYNKQRAWLILQIEKNEAQGRRLRALSRQLIRQNEPIKIQQDGRDINNKEATGKAV